MIPEDDPNFYCHGQKCLDEGCSPMSCAQTEDNEEGGR